MSPVEAARDDAVEEGFDPLLRAYDRRAIRTSGRSLDSISADALAALERSNDPPSLFVRGGALVRRRADERDRPFVEQVSEPALRGRLARVADFCAAKHDGAQLVSPPLDAVLDILAVGEWPFPPLAGITEAPALRPNGTVLGEPGYDSATGLVYMPAPELRMLAVPTEPTAEQLGGAVELLNETLTDFPFVDQPARANALALLLTPVVRPAIGGQVPLALLDATKAGTGKGLLASVAATIATGQAAAPMTAPVREEEWEKRIFAQILRGASLVLIDEARELGSPALAGADRRDLRGAGARQVRDRATAQPHRLVRGRQQRQAPR